MSREILFKGQRKSDMSWIYGNLLRTEDGIFIIQNHVPYHLLKKYEVLEGTVCEYTGLNDKNDSKIFENDIIGRYSEYREELYYGVVKYGEFNCSCCSGVYGWYFDDEDIRDCNMYEVIGNVFDNPELLEGVKVE